MEICWLDHRHRRTRPPRPGTLSFVDGAGPRHQAARGAECDLAAGDARWGRHLGLLDSSLYGVVTTIRAVGDLGLNVFGFAESFQWPSEVFSMNFSTGNSSSAYHDKDRRIFDAALFPGPTAVMAAVEPPGRLNTVPIPGKVKMLSSVNLTDWKEMEVDYRAVATTLTLAGPDRDHLWAVRPTPADGSCI